MITFDPSEHHFADTHRILLGGVAPRPIAFVGSLDKDGRPNLAPFSFFNAFGSNPPIVCFSPSLSGRTGAPKDTLLNVLETKECTISIISYEMVHQASLASAPYEHGVDEFVKAGFTKRAGVKVKAPSVAESKFVIEAKLVQHIEFGGLPSGPNMLVCEVLLMHVAEEVMNTKGGIDPVKLDPVARMGGAWYSRAKEGLFELPQPMEKWAGVDRLPEQLRTSRILTGEDLAKLASRPELPEIRDTQDASRLEQKHRTAKHHLEHHEIDRAWEILAED